MCLQEGLVPVIGLITLSGRVLILSAARHPAEPVRNISVGLLRRNVTDKAQDRVLAVFSVFLDMILFFHAGGVKHTLLRLPLREGKHDKDKVCPAAVPLLLRRRGIADQRVFRNLFRRVVENDVIEPEAAGHNIKKNPRDQDRLQGDQDIGEFFSEKRFHTKNASLLVTKLL